MQKDTYWKGIIEDLAEDLLHFFFPDYVDQIDFSREIEFMDKELDQFVPDAEAKGRRVDKLLKVWLRNGAEAWFLIHIEVQGYRDTEFGLRMFQSAYRIMEKFGKPLVALVIYTDTDRRGHVSEYRTSFLGTKLSYEFNTYVVMDHPLEELAASDNIFAAVLEAAGTQILHGASDKEKSRLSLDLARRLLQNGWPRSKVVRILNFIRYTIRLDKEEESLNFEQTFESITKHKGPMGIQEVIVEEIKQEALEKGQTSTKRDIILKGHAQGLPVELLSKLTDWPEEKVKGIIAENVSAQPD